MNQIQIYLHGENSRDFKLIEINENALIEDIIVIYQKEFLSGGSAEEIDIFLENDELPKNRKQSVNEYGIGKKNHVHAHRCKKIHVTVFYNGVDKPFELSPAVTSTVVLRKAVKAFDINEADASDYLLKLEDKTILQSTDHIGSYVSFPHCRLKLFLTPTKPVQG